MMMQRRMILECILNTKKCILGYIFSLQNTEDEETFVVSVIAQIIKGQRESSFSDKGS